MSTSTIFLLDASGQSRRVAEMAVYGISVCTQITCSRSCTFLAFSHGSECVCVCVCVCVCFPLCCGWVLALCRLFGFVWCCKGKLVGLL